MRYLGREISRRHSAVVTFVLISFLISGKLVRARPQENFVVASSPDSGSKSNVNSSEIKEVVTEKTDPEIATVESDNRYNRSFIRSETHAMYTYLEHYGLSRISSSSSSSIDGRRFLRDFRDCMATVSSAPREFLSPHHTKLVLLYLKKIKTKIKDRHPALRTLQRDLRTAFRQMDGSGAKNATLADHFKFFVLVLFLRLFLKHAPPPPSRSPASESDALFYVERIVDIYLRSFERSKCRHHSRVKRSLRDDRSYASPDYSFKSSIPLQVEERLPYVDDVYRDELIAGFLANSLPDLHNNPTSAVVESPADKSAYFTTSTPLLVDEVGTVHFPKPKPSLSITSTMSTPSNEGGQWTIQSTSDLRPVPLLANKPSSLHFTTESQIQWASQPTQSSPQQWNRKPSYPGIGDNRPHSKPSTPIQIVDDLVLHFPYPSPPSDETGPIFVEPIVVSSADQLPTNYPIANTSLGHNPITVLVDGKPPEIIVLEDVNIHSTVTIEQDAVPFPAGASAEGAPVAGVAEAPVAADTGAAAGPAAGSAASLAAAAAGLGALGALGAAAGGAGVIGGSIAGGIGAGSSAAAAAGASAAGGAGAGGGADGAVDAVASGSGSSTDVVAYSPATSTSAEDEFEAIFGELYDFMIYVVSLRFVRNVMAAIYSIVVPHVSFLVTSGFTVISFLFPWLYPHIVVPVTSFLSSLT